MMDAVGGGFPLQGPLLTDPIGGITESASKKKRSIGHLAVWSLSSCKQGFGVAQLRDNNTSTYWQSDGPQPHLVNLQFPKKMDIQEIAVYADYTADESYTPNKISIRAGTSFHDLQEVKAMELTEPSGWVYIPVESPSGRPLRANMIQFAVITNHQNGRDTHLRLLEVYSPLASLLPPMVPFTSDECAAYGCVR